MVLAVTLWTAYSVLLERRPAGVARSVAPAGSIAFGPAALGPLVLEAALRAEGAPMLPADPAARGRGSLPVALRLARRLRLLDALCGAPGGRRRPCPSCT